MRVLSRFACIIALACMTLATGFTVEAQSDGPAAQPGKDPTIKVISPAEEKAVRAFWTREKIAAARPMEMPASTGSAEVMASAANESSAIGTPGRSPAGAPSPRAQALLRTAYAADWKMIEDASAAPTSSDMAAEADAEAAAQLNGGELEGTSQVFTSYTVNHVASVQTLYPHAWVGRLSFTIPGSGTSYCSATVVSGNNIITAAHCLYDSTLNRWYSNWTFIPAYRNGSAPFGTFSWRTCQILPQWINLTGNYSVNTWARYDVGVCTMGTNSVGVSLNNAVGWAGRQWNWPYVRHLHTLGYPFKNTSNVFLPNAGLFLRTCAAETFVQALDIRGMGCNWGGGISGGPWMSGYAPGTLSGWVDGVNSGIFIGVQNLYGPRFNDFNIVPLCRSRGC